MQIPFIPAQNNALVSAANYNANLIAIRAALQGVEDQFAGAVRDLHGSGILRGFQPIAGANFITITPGAAYAQGVRLAADLATNLATPPYSVCRAWVYDNPASPVALTVPVKEYVWDDNTPHASYGSVGMGLGLGPERVADAAADGGYYTRLVDGTVVITYSGKGALHMLVRKAANGGTATVEYRHQPPGGSWSEWLPGTAATNTSLQSSGVSYGNDIVIAAPDPDDELKEVRLTATGEVGIESYYYLAPDDAAPSEHAADICWVYTGANGAIIRMVDTRRNMLLGNEWAKLLETKYKLLSAQIVCSHFWYDGFGSLSGLGPGTTAFVDAGAHTVSLGPAAPYPTATSGRLGLLGAGTEKTETVALTDAPAHLVYPVVRAGSVRVTTLDGATTYPYGFIVDHDQGTIRYDSSGESNPIPFGAVVKVSYIGLSRVDLSAITPGAHDVLVKVRRGTTASDTAASAPWLSRDGALPFALAPKRGIDGAAGNALKVTVSDGANRRQTIPYRLFNDRGVPPLSCMELKGKFTGDRGNYIRASISAADGARLANGDFESATLTNWTTQGDDLGSWTLDTSHKHSGARALKCHKTVDEGQMRAYQQFDLKPGLQYRVTVWFRSDVCGAGIEAYLRIMSADRSTPIAATQFVSGAERNISEWQCAQFDFTGPDTMVRAAVVIDVASDIGSVWIDDCTVMTLSPDAFKLRLEDGNLAPWYEPIALTSQDVTCSDGIAANALDGDPSTCWQGSGADPWWACEFPAAPEAITGIAVFVAPGTMIQAQDVIVERRDATGAWLQVAGGPIVKGWLGLRFAGAINCYAVRLRTCAPLAEVVVYSDTLSETRAQHPDVPLTANLLSNGSFEGWETRGGQAQPVAWTYQVGGADAAAQYTTQPSLVAHQARSAFDTSAVANHGVLTSEAVAVVEGRDYMALVLCQAASLGPDSSAAASLVPVSDSGIEQTPIGLTTATGAAAVTTASGWTLLGLRWTATQPYAKLALSRVNQGDVYWDDAKLILVGETFDRLTLDNADPALAWAIPYCTAISAVNGAGGSSFAQLVNLTADPAFAHRGVTMNPATGGFAHLSGGGTELTTVKLNVRQYESLDDGTVGSNVVKQETFDNLTVVPDDTPGGFTPPNRDLVSTINERSSLVDIVTAVPDNATWSNNPAPGQSWLAGGITEYDAVDLSVFDTTPTIIEAEDATGGMGSAQIRIQTTDFIASGDANASGGEQLVGTGAMMSPAVLDLFLEGPIGKVSLIGSTHPTYGTLAVSIAEVDENGNLGLYTSQHACLAAVSVDQGVAVGYQHKWLVAQDLTGRHPAGPYKTYVLRLAGLGTVTIDAFEVGVVAAEESYHDLSVCPSAYAQQGKSPLVTTLNSGYGGQGPSAIVTALAAAYTAKSDNPALISAWMTGADGQTMILESPIFDAAPLAYWDQFIIYAEYDAPEGTSIAFQYCLNPLSSSPVWRSATPGELPTTSASAGENLMRLRAVLATSAAALTPTLYDWGLFWGEPVYAPEGARSVVDSGSIELYVASDTQGQWVGGAFHVSSVGSGTGLVNIPVACHPSRVTVEIRKVYVGAYEAPGYSPTYGYAPAYPPATEVRGWAHVEETSALNRVTVAGEDVEVYVAGTGDREFSIWWKAPVGWQVELNWTCEGWL